MPAEWLAWVPTMLTTLGAIVMVGIQVWANRRKVASEADDYDARASQTVAEAANMLIEPLKTRLVEVETRNQTVLDELMVIKRQHTKEREAWAMQLQERDGQRAQMQAEIDELRGGIVVLVAQLQAAGIPPRYNPKPGLIAPLP